MDELDTLLEFAVTKAIAANPSQKEPPWSEAEIRFLHENAGKLDDIELANALGRTPNAIKVFRVRQGLKVVSQAGIMWITANAAAQVLGIDSHKLVYWCRSGLLPARKKVHEPSGREYFLVKRETLKRWCVDPEHWVYFDWKLITDEHLRRLCELRAARWGDEWWTTRQVAEYHQVDVRDVTRLIWHKRIEATCPPVSRGGRHPIRRWAYWFVRRSVATGLKFLHHGDDLTKSTPRADSWILKARDELHLPWHVIGRSMGSRRKGTRGKTGTTISNRYQYLQGQISMAEDWLYSLKYGG